MATDNEHLPACRANVQPATMRTSTFYSALYRAVSKNRSTLVSFFEALGTLPLLLMTFDAKTSLLGMNEVAFCQIVRVITWLLYQPHVDTQKYSMEMARILDPDNDAYLDREVLRLVHAVCRGGFRLLIVQATDDNACQEAASSGHPAISFECQESTFNSRYTTTYRCITKDVKNDVQKDVQMLLMDTVTQIFPSSYVVEFATRVLDRVHGYCQETFQKKISHLDGLNKLISKTSKKVMSAEELLEDRKVRLAQVIHDVHAEDGRLREELTRRQRRIQTLEEQRDSLEELRDSLEEQCKASKKHIQSLQEQHDTLEEQCKTSTNRIQSLEEQRDTLEEQRDTLEEQCKTSKKHIQSLEEQHDSLMEQRDTLEEQCKTSKKHIQSLEEQRDSLMEQRDTLKEQCKTSKTHIQTLEAEAAVLSVRRLDAVGDVDALLADIKDAHVRVPMLSSDIKKLHRQEKDFHCIIDGLQRTIHMQHLHMSTLQGQVAGIYRGLGHAHSVLTSTQAAVRDALSGLDVVFNNNQTGYLNADLNAGLNKAHGKN